MTRRWQCVRGPAGLLVASLIASFACATATISSNRDPSFRGPITRLVVLVVDPQGNDARMMKSGMLRQLEQRSVAHLVFTISSDNDLPRNQPTIDAFKPQAILRITPTAEVVDERGRRKELHYDASCSPVTDPGHRIWRAQVLHKDFQGEETNMRERMALAAAKIVEQMAVDGLLVGGPVAPTTSQTDD